MWLWPIPWVQPVDSSALVFVGVMVWGWMVVRFILQE